MNIDRRLLALAAGMFAVGTDSFVVAGILPQVAESLNVPVSVAGQMVTVYALSYALLSPLIAALASHWPRKRLLLTGLAIFVIGNAVTAMAPTLGLVLASRFIAGLGAAMYSPTATATGAALAAPEKRAQALAIVIAGLSSATALGSPLGAFIGSLGNWRDTLWFVSAVGLAAMAAVQYLLPAIAALPSASLQQRLAPLKDSRVVLTLLTTLAAYAGMFSVYTYMGVSFDRATGGRPEVLAGLMLLWGVAATAGNLAAGRLTDRFGSRAIINGAIAVLVLNFLALPWTSASLPTAAIALVIWGVCGWGLVVPQQARLIQIAPAAAPLLMGLNSAALYVGVSAAGVVGAAGIAMLDHHLLGLIAAAPIALAFIFAQLASRKIRIAAALGIALSFGAQAQPVDPNHKILTAETVRVTVPDVKAGMPHAIQVSPDITLRRMVYRPAHPKGTLLFLHGFPETMYAWKPIAESLAGDYEVHAFDWPGYGQSSRPSAGRFAYAPIDYAHVLEDYIRAAGIDRSKLVIYASDIGALPALLAALEQPDIARKIIVGDFAPFNRPQYMYETLQGLKSKPSADAVHAAMNKGRDEILANAFFRGLPAEQRYPIPQDFRDDMAKGWGGEITSADAFYHYYANFTRDQDYFEANMSQLKVPLEVLWGEQDIYINNAMGREFAQRSKAKLTILPNLGHYPHLQAPEQTAAELRAALAGPL